MRSYSLILLGTLVLAPTIAHAAEPIEEARILFNEGSAQFQAHHFEAALGLLERSYATIPSPNTKLLIARCLRELGRKADAAQAFLDTEKLARKHVAQGESKYAPTADVAANEGNKLRSELGTIKIHVSGNATVTVDGKPVNVASGDAVVLHDPGTVSVEVKDASGQRQSQSVTVLAGSTVAMQFVAHDPPPPPVAPPPPIVEPDRRPPEKNAWTGPAAWVSGGVAAVGLGVFIGFGVSSQNTYDNLAARCGATGCPPSERVNADRGERDQAIANVGLGIAVLATLATATFIVLNKL